MSKEILEYKMDANCEGNGVVPGFVDHSDCGHFSNPANFTCVGIRLAAWVKVPDSVVKLTRAELKVRNYGQGICMKLVDGEPVQMSNEEIDALVDAFCNARDID